MSSPWRGPLFLQNNVQCNGEGQVVARVERAGGGVSSLSGGVDAGSGVWRFECKMSYLWGESRVVKCEK